MCLLMQQSSLLLKLDTRSCTVFIKASVNCQVVLIYSDDAWLQIALMIIIDILHNCETKPNGNVCYPKFRIRRKA